MSESMYDSTHIEQLYEYGERLSESKDKAQNVEEYKGILELAKTSTKAKQLAAQLIPRFFKFFPDLSGLVFDTLLDLVEDEDLGVRVQGIRGLPLLCKDMPPHLPKIVDVLIQMVSSEETVEKDAAHKALLSLLRQDAKASLNALFKHLFAAEEAGADESFREKALSFIRDKIFPMKNEILKPQQEMERFITDLIKKSLQDVTGEEFKMFMNFLKSLSLFGEKSPPERMQELTHLIELQADLDAQFDVSDGDHIERLMSCLHMALPFFTRGESSSKYLNFINKHILPVVEKLPVERRLDFLKAVAEISNFSTPQDARQILPSVVQLLKIYVPKTKLPETHYTAVECLLYTFHHLAHKAPNATNSVCGYKIVTGQPSDRLGEDFSSVFKDFTERVSSAEEAVRVTMKKLTQGMAERNKAMAATKTEDEKEKIKTEKQRSTALLRSCNNILAMTKPLHAKTPVFIGDRSVNLSWIESAKANTATTAVAGVKRSVAPANGSGNQAKRGRGYGGRGRPGIGVGGGPRGGRGRGRGGYW